MTQQKPSRNADDVFKRKLFYDNGIKFVQVRGRLTGEYTPPTPTMKSHANTTIQSSSGLVQRGTAHYNITLQFLFSSKKEYTDWLQFIGAEHKYYDEKGTIYLGVVSGELQVQPVEQESKYLVTVTLIMVKKQDFEFRHKAAFIDIDGHWAEKYIDEMQQRGLISVYGTDGQAVQYFRPEVYLTRAQMVAFVTRTYKHIDKILRGY